MKPKEKRQEKMQVMGEKHEPSAISLFRKKWLKEGYDLVDITRLCKFRLGDSGWCNDFNEPDDQIYHIQVFYRDDNIGTLSINEEQLNWDEEYVVFVDDQDFIIFRKVKIDEKTIS